MLDQDWSPGDYRDLAQRYVEACYRVPALASRARSIAFIAGNYKLF